MLENPEIDLAFLMNLPGIIYWKDVDGRFLGANQGTLDLLELESLEYLKGQTAFDFWHEVEAENITQHDQLVLRDQKLLYQEEYGPVDSSFHQTKLWVEKKPLSDKEGNLIGLISTALPIDQYSQFDLNILSDEMEGVFSLEHVLQFFPGNIYWKDRQGTIMGCNQNSVDLFGKKDFSEIVGYKDTDIMPGHYSKKIIEVDQAIMDSGRPLILEEQGIDRYGRPAIYFTHKLPIKNNEGTVEGVFGVSIDISRVKNLETFLKNAKKDVEFSLNAILDAMPGTVYWKNELGIYQGCNQNLLDILDKSSLDDIVGKSDEDLLPTDMAKTVRHVDDVVLKSGELYTVEELGYNRQKEPAFYYTSKIPLKNDQGDVIGLLGASVDISDRKKIEEELVQAKERAEAADLEKTNFLMNLSHDLRTPCSNISGLVALLLNDPQDRSDLYLKHLYDSSHALLDMMDAIFDATNGDVFDDSRVVINQCHLNKILDLIISLVTPQAKQKNIQFLVENEVDDAVCFLSDEVKIQRILLNLLSNAIKFTSEGHVTLKASCLTLSENLLQLQLVIHDTGIGIDPIAQDKIFDQYVRLTPAFRGEYEGMGVGLYIVRKFVEQLKGEIFVSSVVGNGSTFTVTIPVHTEEVVVQSSEQARCNSSSIVDHKRFKSVLLVEDDSVASLVAKTLLNQYVSDTVHIAICGEDALSQLQKHSYELIVLDIGLPDMSGVELADRIRERVLPSVLIVALTAHLHANNDFNPKETVFNAIFSKPLSVEMCSTIRDITQ